MKTGVKQSRFIRYTAALLLFAWMFLSPVRMQLHASDVLKTDIRLQINQNFIPTEYEIFTQNARLMVPIRLVAQTLGADISWNQADKSVVMEHDKKKVTLYIDKFTAFVDEKEITLDAKPFVYKGRAMVPIRFLAEQLDCSVKWDPEARTASIDKNLHNADKVEFEVIADLSNYLFLDKYVKDHSTYALGHHFVKDGYSYVIVSYGQQRTGGYQVKVDSVYFLEQQYDDQKYFVVKSHLQAPAPDAIVTMALTYPYAIIRFENKDSLDVRITFDSSVNKGELQ